MKTAPVLHPPSFISPPNSAVQVPVCKTPITSQHRGSQGCYCCHMAQQSSTRLMASLTSIFMSVFKVSPSPQPSSRCLSGRGSFFSVTFPQDLRLVGSGVFLFLSVVFRHGVCKCCISREYLSDKACWPFFFLSRCELLEADKEDELSQQPVHGRCGETHFLYEFFMGGKLSFWKKLLRCSMKN